jgi:hypothetical protein
MKKLNVFIFLFTICFSTISKADEGMWLPFLLNRNYEDMKKNGLKLTQEQIYDINNASLKDAIVSFGGFCTAEVISTKGLLLTNHHCGYDAIAGASTEAANYLKNGFWAKSLNEEIAIPGLTATFIIRIEDVSDAINKELTSSMNANERGQKIKEISKLLTDEAVKGTDYEAFVRDFYEGNEFYLFVKETYKDVRLVGAPPADIGKYGYDTDNWVWPRHTGDFSMFRVYADGSNKPADFSKENAPLKPKHHLPVSLKGVQEGDYAMVMGFPGSTDRFLSSFGVKQAVDLDQPKRVELRAEKLAIMKRYMDKDETVHLKYASKYAQVANYWKYFIGQTAQLKKNNVYEKKQALEAEFAKFAQNKKEYASVLADLKSSYAVLDKYNTFNVYINEAIFSVDVNLLAYRSLGLGNALEKNDADLIKASTVRLAEAGKSFFDKFNADIEAEIITEMFKRYYNDVPKDQQAEFIRKLGDKSKGDFSKFVAGLRKKSIFFNESKFNAFIENPTKKALEADQLYQLISSVLTSIRANNSRPDLAEAQEKQEKAYRLFVKGLREMQPNKKFYPNANSTMRLTYGQVLPYKAKDAVNYDYITTIDGIFEKEIPGDFEFTVPERLRELWKAKDYGQYADKNGQLIVNFLTNNDITGGNSGSPVIDANGYLIGTAFDGNWEAMSGDIFFEPNIQRTIVCDIRYVLFVVDKYAGATNIIEELELIK